MLGGQFSCLLHADMYDTITYHSLGGRRGMRMGMGMTGRVEKRRRLVGVDVGGCRFKSR